MNKEVAVERLGCHVRHTRYTLGSFSAHGKGARGGGFGFVSKLLYTNVHSRSPTVFMHLVSGVSLPGWEGEPDDAMVWGCIF